MVVEMSSFSIVCCLVFQCFAYFIDSVIGQSVDKDYTNAIMTLIVHTIKVSNYLISKSQIPDYSCDSLLFLFVRVQINIQLKSLLAVQKRKKKSVCV